ncbi:MAG: hypothetical protein OXE97_13300, partial [Gammaproteobacteria bacterium]|nr:hypothetical protein [Gammaproteobacteria bacterium]
PCVGKTRVHHEPESPFTFNRNHRSRSPEYAPNPQQHHDTTGTTPDDLAKKEIKRPPCLPFPDGNG